MSQIAPTIMEFVRRRAKNRCEYCMLHQNDSQFTFHVDHVISQQHGGTHDVANLCLSCLRCNLQKGPNLAGLLNGKLYPLFNPRRQNWHRHFEWDQTLLVGKTATGIVTIQVLEINCEESVLRRETILFEGRLPPDDH
jgi:hypothetical protein